MKILFTGATGQVARPVAEALAADHQVWCAARFSDPEVKAALEAKGIGTFHWSLGDSLEGLDDDFTHVMHAAPYRGQPDSESAAQANAVATGMLMHHCRKAQAFLQVSTFAVYAKPPTPEHHVAETDPLGVHAPYAPSYPVGKLAAEGAARAFAAVLGLPTTIARLNVCYGPTGWGGLPVEFFERIAGGEPIWLPADGSEIWCSPISTDDVIRFVPALWDVASVSPTIVNLAGDEAVSQATYMEHLAQLAGLEVRFMRHEAARVVSPSNNDRRRSLIGDCQVGWREGMPRAIEAHVPGAFDQSGRAVVTDVKPNIWGQR